MVYVKGGSNVVADALSRLPIQEVKNNELFLNRRVFENQISFPLDLEIIKKTQENDEQLKRLLNDSRSKKYIKISK